MAELGRTRGTGEGSLRRPAFSAGARAVLLLPLVWILAFTGCLGGTSAGDEENASFWKEPSSFYGPVATGPTCTDSLQAKVDAAPAGATVRAEPCVHREQIVVNKPITLEGQPGSEIRGSDVWKDWERDGDFWRSRKALPHFPQVKVRCIPGTSRCLWPEQVFFDGRPLRQVDSEPGSGQFAVDAGRHVLLKDDPGGQLVEVTVRRHWVLGEADNVTVRNFTMRHASNAGRSGAVMNRPEAVSGGYDGWMLQDNRLSDAHGAVVNFDNATGLRVLGNDISRGGQLGVQGSGSGEIISGNKIHDNNTEGFDWEWEAGGIKTSYADNVEVSSNEIYRNKGSAVWFDIDSRNNTISDNRIYDNARYGIHYEISEGGRIFDNVIWENGWGTPDWASGAGIALGNSSDTEVYDNILAWNADGIAVVALDREGASWDRVRDVYVHDNTVLSRDRIEHPEENFALAWLQGGSAQVFNPSSGNRGERNRYWYPDPEGESVRYEWNKDAFSKLADFNATPGEENGRYLSEGEKAAVVAGEDIPASPRSRRQVPFPP